MTIQQLFKMGFEPADCTLWIHADAPDKAVGSMLSNKNNQPDNANLNENHKMLKLFETKYISPPVLGSVRGF